MKFAATASAPSLSVATTNLAACARALGRWRLFHVFTCGFEWHQASAIALYVYTVCIVFASTSRAAPPESLLRPTLAEDGRVGFAALLERGYTPLFNTEDLDGWWNPYDHGEAKVVDGEIHLKANKKFFLVTEQKYRDFRLTAEIHLPEGKANSGIMFRCQVDPSARKKVFGYQAECDGSDRRWSGGLYDEARRGWIWPSIQGRSEPQFLLHEAESKDAFGNTTVRNALNRNGWNQFTITCIQDRITIELNGIQTVHFRDTLDHEGYIAIQHHGEKGQIYRFRNLFIKELPLIPADDTVKLERQPPAGLQTIDNKTVLVDFGKVAFGNVSLRVPEEGRGFAKLHFGEKLKNGRVDRVPPGTVRYGAAQVRLGSGERGNWVVPAPIDLRNTEQVGVSGSHPPAVLTPAEWQPIMPFRWVEIENWPGEFKPEMITRRAAFTEDWNDEASNFESSLPLLNEVWDLCKYSIKATTFAGVYVDGERERIPYEADAYLNQLSHYATDDSPAMAARTFDWLMENGTWPTEWAPHMVFMAHDHWMHTGDVQWLSHRYELLKPKTLLRRVGENGLVRSDQLDQSKHDIVDWPAKERDGFVFTEVNTVVNAFHIEALRRMSAMAQAVGKQDEAAAFARQAELAHNSFESQLFNADIGLYRDGVGTDHTSVHANLFPLAFGLVSPDRATGVSQWLADQDMKCSVYAAQYLMDGLFRSGHDKAALELMLADNDRSWKHMVESGTTITWEAWDLKYKPNQDWNHAWGAAPANLLPRFVLGVQVADPGWEIAIVSPRISGLESAEGKVPTPRGPIAVQWQSADSFQMQIDLPPGVTAWVDVPATDDSQIVRLNGKTLSATQVDRRWKLEQPVEGSATIEVRLP